MLLMLVVSKHGLIDGPSNAGCIFSAISEIMEKLKVLRILYFPLYSENLSKCSLHLVTFSRDVLLS